MFCSNPPAPPISKLGLCCGGLAVAPHVGGNMKLRFHLVTGCRWTAKAKNETTSCLHNISVVLNLTPCGWVVVPVPLSTRRGSHSGQLLSTTLVATNAPGREPLDATRRRAQTYCEMPTATGAKRDNTCAGCCAPRSGLGSPTLLQVDA